MTFLFLKKYSFVRIGGRIPATLVLAFLVLSPHGFAASPPAPERQAEIRHMVRHECGACHGLTLEGGLGPPLTEAALAERPASVLVSTILQGREGTPMPPWKPFLSRSEAGWLVQQLKKGKLHE